MKGPLTYFLIFLALTGCQKEDKLTFESVILRNDICADCPEISISIPRAIENSRAAHSINSVLEEEIIALLHFDEDTEISNLDDALLSFTNGFTEIKNLYSEETTPWEAKIEGKVVYEDKEILTLLLDSYIFTGGAHGYSAKRFLNFDKNKGIALENWELFQNRKGFQLFAEAKFREQEAIPAEASINYTGFMFEKDRFYLPENIGYTNEGVKLLYNPYEVASYADGAIVLTLPFKEVAPFLASKNKS
ncbi:hypothetical protein LCGC14_2208830 [marine sediment metagenome]|uniref:DUF3298/DUF4163 domain-containing protein n=2 Tax=root TaxID=1 RepID=A0A831QLM7_9FLAO|nr:DUF3298/DUF4163 domain-containing protein [Pricia antarctica]